MKKKVKKLITFGLIVLLFFNQFLFLVEPVNAIGTIDDSSTETIKDENSTSNTKEVEEIIDVNKLKKENDISSELVEKNSSSINTLKNLGNLFYLETPVQNEYLSKNVNIRGWFLSESGAKKMELYIDGNFIKELSIGKKRTDVLNKYPEYQNEFSGYEDIYDSSNLAEGSHKFEIKIADNNGASSSYSINVQKKNKTKSFLEVDDGKKVGNSFIIAGWALSEDGIKDVEISVNNQTSAIIKTDFPRPDVYKLYPEFENENSGFRYTLNTKNLPVGKHQLQVRILTNNGTVLNYVKTIEKVSLPERIYVETPLVSQSIKNSIPIRGWFLSELGTDKVSLFVNNQFIKDLSIQKKRLDVLKVYNEYQNEYAGFEDSYDTSALPEGPYKIEIRGYGVNGKTFSQIIDTKKEIITHNFVELSENKKVSEPFVLAGWALSEDGIDKVNISVDGELISTIKTDYPRPDVYQLYPNFDNKNAGFRFNFDPSKLTKGKHKVTVEYVTNTGKIIRNEKNIEKVELTGNIYVETPIVNKELDKIVKIRGWFLSPKGTKKVSLYVDNIFIKDLEIGKKRTDVSNKYPEYQQEYSGFEDTYDSTKLSEGKHTFEIRGYGNNEKTYSKIINVEKKIQVKSYLEVGENQKVSQPFIIAGWALSEDEINKVDIFVDNQKIGSVKTDFIREDVFNLYPEFNNKNSGFRYTFDPTSLSIGKHNLVVKIVTNTGKIIEYKRVIEKINLKDLSYLETPVNWSENQSKLAIRGWILPKEGTVSRVSVIINGSQITNTQINLSRMDVFRAHPEYNNYNAGFETIIDNPTLKNGQNKVTVRIMLSNGNFIDYDRIVFSMKTNLPLKTYIDAPIENSLISSKNQVVKGWAIASEGVREIKIYVDNQFKGNATLGLSRQDVFNAHPQYGITDSGFSYTLNSAAFNAGSHKLKVEFISNQGKKITSEQTFFVGDLPLLGRKIFIDAGHGGSDPGAVANGLREKDLNLAVALKVQKLLEEKGASVTMSRTTDVFLSLGDISNKANLSKADIFVSIHHNSAVPEAYGIETYSYVGGTSFSKALNAFLVPDLLELEDNQQGEVNLLKSNSDPNRLYQSKKLADAVQRSLILKTGAYNRGSKVQDFHVIRETNMPAILTELGFITNFSEAQKLGTNNYQNQLANGVYEGIVNYFK